MALPATETFTNTNGTQLTAHSANWTLNNGDFDIQTNALSPDAIAAECMAHWNADAFDDNQYAQATLVAVSSGFSIGVAVRCHASAHTGYGFYVDGLVDPSAYLWKEVAGTWTQLGSTFNKPANGSIIRIEAVGTAIRALDDGVVVQSATDSSITSGSAGVSGYNDSATPQIDGWEGGNIPTLEQEGFRWGVDDGNEAAHTWQAAQDTNITIVDNQSRLLRVIVNADNDPPNQAYSLRYQKNGSGGYALVPVGAAGATIPPTVEAADCTESGNNTATTSWAVSYPAYVNGDLLIFHVASDANVTHNWPATGPSGETITDISDSTGGTEQRASAFWFKGTATTSAGTLTVTPSATEQWTAVVLKVLAGEFNPTTPIQANIGTANDTVADVNWETPAWTADATANGRVIAFGSHDLVTTTSTPAGWTTLIARDRGVIGCTLAARNAANTASESIASASFTKSSETDSSIGYIINGVVTNNETYITTSANIAAGGEATTARLTAPSGKTTSDFTTGGRWDDENGTDSTNIANNFYTELEWLTALADGLTNGDYFEYRVYAAGVALDTYTFTARWTVGTGGATTGLMTTNRGFW